MLGYTIKDLKKMKASTSMFLNKTDDQDVLEGLTLAIDFLTGLEAEGYFE